VYIQRNIIIYYTAKYHGISSAENQRGLCGEQTINYNAFCTEILCRFCKYSIVSHCVNNLRNCRVRFELLHFDYIIM